jgi:ribonuclease HIII
MYGPNEFNIFQAINLHATSINLCLIVHHLKIITQTFHSQLDKYFDHILLTLFSQRNDTTRIVQKWVDQFVTKPKSLFIQSLA